MRVVISILLSAVPFLAAAALAEVPYPSAPDWLSAEDHAYGTGCDFGDVDGDGWLDLAVSNGNDMLQAPNYVYLSQGGVLPTQASWTSADARYSGHCELADLDADGWPELMVANYISPGWGLGWIQVYDNAGGELATAPGWESPHDFNSFRAGFGDPDGDGDLDLGVGTGEAYNDRYQNNVVFFNDGGALAPAAGWTSADANAAYDAQFVDVDGDGDQDFAVCEGAVSGRVKVYRNDGGVLATSPWWEAGQAGNGNTFDFDDLDRDGDPDLAVHYNDQLGGTGKAVIYWNQDGALATEPGWSSAFDGYGSAIVCADVDADGWPDLIAGAWWSVVRIYLNRGGGFATTPDWQSGAATASVVENFALADLDEGGTRPATATFAAGSGPHLQLPHRHLQRVTSVAVDGVALPRAQWCSHLRDGWVSVASSAPEGEVTVAYAWSPTLDLAVSNWDGSTYVFGWQGSTGAPDTPPATRALLAAVGAAPSPFNPATTVTFELTAAATVRLDVFDARGRLVATPLRGYREAGRHAVPWRPDGLASGVYLYRLAAGGEARSGSVVLAR